MVDTEKAKEYLYGLARCIRDDVQDFGIIETMKDVAFAYELIGIELPPEISHAKLWDRWLAALPKRHEKKF